MLHRSTAAVRHSLEKTLHMCSVGARLCLCMCVRVSPQEVWRCWVAAWAGSAPHCVGTAGASAAGAAAARRCDSAASGSSSCAASAWTGSFEAPWGCWWSYPAWTQGSPSTVPLFRPQPLGSSGIKRFVYVLCALGFCCLMGVDWLLCCAAGKLFLHGDN